MSNTAYYLAWLAAGLAATAMASAWITRQFRWRAGRRLAAEQALDALARYCHWISSQRHASFFQGDAHDDAGPLHELLAITTSSFPESAAALVELLSAHARLVNYLWSQQALRQGDPEAWLESDHDAGFMTLWQRHIAAAEALALRLRLGNASSARALRLPAPSAHPCP